MKNIVKLFIIVLIASLIVLIITNPTVKQLKDYSGEYSDKFYRVVYSRKENYIVFSTFKISYIRLSDPDNRYYRNHELEIILNNLSGDYYGVLLNFYKQRI